MFKRRQAARSFPVLVASRYNSLPTRERLGFPWTANCFYRVTKLISLEQQATTRRVFIASRSPESREISLIRTSQNIPSDDRFVTRILRSPRTRQNPAVLINNSMCTQENGRAVARWELFGHEKLAEMGNWLGQQRDIAHVSYFQGLTETENLDLNYLWNIGRESLRDVHLD